MNAPLTVLGLVLGAVSMPFLTSDRTGRAATAPPPSTESLVLAPAPGPDVRTPINSLPLVITQSGSYYVTKDLTGVAGSAGITIAAADVTIDLNGFALRGVPGSLDGITADPAAQNIHVHNGMVRDWGGTGIKLFLGLSENGRLENLTVSGNGARGLAAFNSVITNVVARGNAAGGILASDSTLRGCLASFNSGAGTQPGINANRSSLLNCTSSDNNTIGFLCDDSVLDGCTAYSNTDGFSLDRSNAQACEARSNQFHGFDLSESTVATSCVSTGNNLGFLVRDGSTLSHSLAADNLSHGIDAPNPPSALVDSNVSVNNAGRGIQAVSGTQVTRNRCTGNTLGNYSVAGTGIGPIGTPSTATSPWANF